MLVALPVHLHLVLTLGDFIGICEDLGAVPSTLPVSQPLAPLTSWFTDLRDSTRG